VTGGRIESIVPAADRKWQPSRSGSFQRLRLVWGGGSFNGCTLGKTIQDHLEALSATGGYLVQWTDVTLLVRVFGQVVEIIREVLNLIPQVSFFIA